MFGEPKNHGEFLPAFNMNGRIRGWRAWALTTSEGKAFADFVARFGEAKSRAWKLYRAWYLYSHPRFKA